MNELYTVQKNVETIWTDNLWEDIVEGNIAPADVLLENDEIEEVEQAIEIIQKYAKTLEYSGFVDIG
jgi:hypothetical protein